MSFNFDALLTVKITFVFLWFLFDEWADSNKVSMVSYTVLFPVSNYRILHLEPAWKCPTITMFLSSSDSIKRKLLSSSLFSKVNVLSLLSFSDIETEHVQQNILN